MVAVLLSLCVCIWAIGAKKVPVLEIRFIEVAVCISLLMWLHIWLVTEGKLIAVAVWKIYGWSYIYG